MNLNRYPIKLVRDNVPELVNPSHEPGLLWYEPLPENEDRGPWLRQKLREEVDEYLEDRSIRELAQTLNVIDALAQHHGTSLMSLVDLMRKDPRGGFDCGMIMYGRHPETDDQ